MNKFMKTMALLTITIALLSGCTNSNDDIKADTNVGQQEGQTVEEDKQGMEDKDSDQGSDEEANEAVEEKVEDKTTQKEKIDLSVKPNEAGEVMVLMYHGIDEEEATWVRTPENFRRDLETLYEKGYRPIRLVDFVNNNIQIEAGYTPVVLTFDDGNQNNFNIIEENGEKVIDPDSAVGIMEAFNEKYPDFNVTATFFLNGSRPFRQDELIDYKLNYLVEHGYDVGNHTLGHNNMSGISDPDKMQRAIGGQVNYLEGILEDYEVNTYALCNGGRPDKSLYVYLEKGVYEGNEYDNVAILNVGWRPSVSPVDKDFNPLAIQRVRASEMNVDGVGMYNWLSSFDKHPERRFISDGNPNIVTVPKKYEDKVDTVKVGEEALYLYEIEDKE